MENQSRARCACKSLAKVAVQLLTTDQSQEIYFTASFSNTHAHNVHGHIYTHIHEGKELKYNFHEKHLPLLYATHSGVF